MGWQLARERQLKDWGRDLGGRELKFRRGDYEATVEYAGERADYGMGLWNRYWVDALLIAGICFSRSSRTTNLRRKNEKTGKATSGCCDHLAFLLHDPLLCTLRLFILFRI